MKWERIPLQIPLKVGQERVVFVDKNVRVGFPPALNGKLRVQSTGGAVYLKADSAFPQTRVQLQDVESGEVLLFDIAAGEKGPTEPVRLVYSGDVSTLSHAGDAFPVSQVVQTGLLPDQAHLLPPAAMMVLRQSVKKSATAPPSRCC